MMMMMMMMNPKETCQLVREDIPQAMDVAEQPYANLEPLFDFLANNMWSGDMYNEFTSGIVYEDGRLDLCKQGMYSLNTELLVQALMKGKPTQLKHFLYDNNKAGYVGGHHITRLMSCESFQKIETWYLAGNDLTPQTISDMAIVVKENHYTRQLWLKRNPLGALGALQVGGLVVNKFPALRVLDISYCAIGNEGVRLLLLKLLRHHNLRSLYLDANNIASDADMLLELAQYFTYASQKLNAIRSLYLSCNVITDHGAFSEFLVALTGYGRIKRLCLANCGLSVELTDKLFHYAAKWERLTYLNLGKTKAAAAFKKPNNVVDPMRAAVFLMTNRSIRVFDVNCDFNNNNSEAARLVLGGVAVDSSLFYLNAPLANNMRQPVKEACAARIEAAYHKTLADYYNSETHSPGPSLRTAKYGRRIGQIDSFYRTRDLGAKPPAIALDGHVLEKIKPPIEEPLTKPSQQQQQQPSPSPSQQPPPQQPPQPPLLRRLYKKRMAAEEEKKNKNMPPTDP